MQLLAAVLLLCLASTQVLGACVVNTTLGAVRGTVMTSRSGRQFCSYRRIPYAQPPVGDLRFKNPVPASPWSEELDATADGPMCVQPLPSGDATVILGQEDCLYVNVYTPLIPESGISVSVPVLFFIHGGSFVTGTGGSTMFGPDFLMDKDIVIVTTNYRLGALGFLSSGDDVSPGNYAFKDQLLALQWTAQNVADFGGEPDKVTIQGESAGSMSVHALILSPQSKGLFRAAISESGSALLPMMQTLDPLSTAKLQAETVNCSTDDVSSMFDCLRGVDASTLIQKQLLGFWPCVVEKKTDSNPEPFMTSTPLEIAMSGNFTKVPWIMGLNSEEGTLFAPSDLLHQSGLDAINNRFDSLALTDFYIQFSVNESMVPQIWKSVADFYLGDNHTVTLDNALDLIHIYSDRTFTHAIHKANVLHSKAGHFPVYKYEFDYQGLYSVTNMTYDNNTRARLGAGHADELLYISKFYSYGGVWPPGHPDLEVVDTMVTLWTNFAIYGNPTPVEAEAPQGVVWPPVDNDSGHVVYYKLGQAQPPTPPVDGVMPLAISTGQDLYKDRVDFWDSLPLMENQGQ